MRETVYSNWHRHVPSISRIHDRNGAFPIIPPAIDTTLLDMIDRLLFRGYDISPSLQSGGWSNDSGITSQTRRNRNRSISEALEEHAIVGVYEDANSQRRAWRKSPSTP